MKSRHIAIMVVLVSVGLAAGEAIANEEDKIEEAALDYLEGYFSSDPGRMAKALHPNLFKCTIRKFPNSDHEILQTMTAEELISLCRINQEWVKDKAGVKSLKILYHDPRIAVVHAVSDGFYDVINLMKLNGEWKIIQVLWDRN